MEEYKLSHLKELEAESIHIIREVAAEFELLASGLLRVRASVTNLAEDVYEVLHLEPALPVPAEAGELLDMTGRHTHERTPQRRPFVMGLHQRESWGGRPGHDNATVMCAGRPGFGWRTGRVWGVHLGWSGNQVLGAEHDETGWRLLRGGGTALFASAAVRTQRDYDTRTRDLVHTLDLLLTGSLAGVFDGPTSAPIDLDAPGVSVDISATAAAGDTLVAAAMLATWSYGFGAVDAANLLADHGLAQPRRHLLVMDELWRALRGAPGLVDHADALTRLNRARGIASLMITHSLADLEALPTPADRAKARGFIDRSAIVVLGGLPRRELDAVSTVVPLTPRERTLVASWSAAESWQPGVAHPGRGRYLIKTGARPGLVVSLDLTPAERDLYDTDTRVRG